MPDTGIHVTLADYPIGGVEINLLENWNHPEKERKLCITSREQRILEKIGSVAECSGCIDSAARVLTVNCRLGHTERRYSI